MDWGDGQTSAFTRTGTGALPAAVHTYSADGDFIATVTVTDKDGGAGSASFTVTVTPPEQRIYLPLVRR